MKFHAGGIVQGPSEPITIERVGVGIDGVCLYSFNGAPPEPVYTAGQVRAVGALALERLRRNLTEDKP